MAEDVDEPTQETKVETKGPLDSRRTLTYIPHDHLVPGRFYTLDLVNRKFSNQYCNANNRWMYVAPIKFGTVGAFVNVFTQETIPACEAYALELVYDIRLQTLNSGWYHDEDNGWKTIEPAP